MKYTELHEVLTNQIEKIASEGLTPEQMKNERYKAEILVKLAKQTIKNGKPLFYDPPDLKAAKQKLEAHLAKHVPAAPYSSGIRLITKWLFPAGDHPDGSYRITKPDTDNLQKALKDIMTKLGFWTDDALVASEITEKFWARVPGIYIRIETLQEE